MALCKALANGPLYIVEWTVLDIADYHGKRASTTLAPEQCSSAQTLPPLHPGEHTPLFMVPSSGRMSAMARRSSLQPATSCPQSLRTGGTNRRQMRTMSHGLTVALLLTASFACCAHATAQSSLRAWSTLLNRFDLILEHYVFSSKDSLLSSMPDCRDWLCSLTASISPAVEQRMSEAAAPSTLSVVAVLRFCASLGANVHENGVLPLGDRVTLLLWNLDPDVLASSIFLLRFAWQSILRDLPCGHHELLADIALALVSEYAESRHLLFAQAHRDVSRPGESDSQSLEPNAYPTTARASPERPNAEAGVGTDSPGEPERSRSGHALWSSESLRLLEDTLLHRKPDLTEAFRDFFRAHVATAQDAQVHMESLTGAAFAAARCLLELSSGYDDLTAVWPSVTDDVRTAIRAHDLCSSSTLAYALAAGSGFLYDVPRDDSHRFIGAEISNWVLRGLDTRQCAARDSTASRCFPSALPFAVVAEEATKVKFHAISFAGDNREAKAVLLEDIVRCTSVHSLEDALFAFRVLKSLPGRAAPLYRTALTQKLTPLFSARLVFEVCERLPALYDAIRGKRKLAALGASTSAARSFPADVDPIAGPGSIAASGETTKRPRAAPKEPSSPLGSQHNTRSRRKRKLSPQIEQVQDSAAAPSRTLRSPASADEPDEPSNWQERLRGDLSQMHAEIAALSSDEKLRALHFAKRLAKELMDNLVSHSMEWASDSTLREAREHHPPLNDLLWCAHAVCREVDRFHNACTSDDTGFATLCPDLIRHGLQQGGSGEQRPMVQQREPTLDGRTGAVACMYSPELASASVNFLLDWCGSCASQDSAPETLSETVCMLGRFASLFRRTPRKKKKSGKGAGRGQVSSAQSHGLSGNSCQVGSADARPGGPPEREAIQLQGTSIPATAYTTNIDFVLNALRLRLHLVKLPFSPSQGANLLGKGFFTALFTEHYLLLNLSAADADKVSKVGEVFSLLNRQRLAAVLADLKRGYENALKLLRQIASSQKTYPGEVLAACCRVLVVFGCFLRAKENPQHRATATAIDKVLSDTVVEVLSFAGKVLDWEDGTGLLTIACGRFVEGDMPRERIWNAVTRRLRQELEAVDGPGYYLRIGRAGKLEPDPERDGSIGSVRCLVVLALSLSPCREVLVRERSRVYLVDSETAALLVRAAQASLSDTLALSSQLRHVRSASRDGETASRRTETHGRTNQTARGSGAFHVSSGARGTREGAPSLSGKQLSQSTSLESRSAGGSDGEEWLARSAAALGKRAQALAALTHSLLQFAIRTCTMIVELAGQYQGLSRAGGRLEFAALHGLAHGLARTWDVAHENCVAWKTKTERRKPERDLHVCVRFGSAAAAAILTRRLLQTENEAAINPVMLVAFAVLPGKQSSDSLWGLPGHFWVLSKFLSLEPERSCPEMFAMTRQECTAILAMLSDAEKNRECVTIGRRAKSLLFYTTQEGAKSAFDDRPIEIVLIQIVWQSLYTECEAHSYLRPEMQEKLFRYDAAFESTSSWDDRVEMSRASEAAMRSLCISARQCVQGQARFLCSTDFVRQPGDGTIPTDHDEYERSSSSAPGSARRRPEPLTPLERWFPSPAELSWLPENPEDYPPDMVFQPSRRPRRQLSRLIPDAINDDDSDSYSDVEEEGETRMQRMFARWNGALPMLEDPSDVVDNERFAPPISTLVNDSARVSHFILQWATELLSSGLPVQDATLTELAQLGLVMSSIRVDQPMNCMLDMCAEVLTSASRGQQPTAARKSTPEPPELDGYCELERVWSSCRLIALLFSDVHMHDIVIRSALLRSVTDAVCATVLHLSHGSAAQRVLGCSAAHKGNDKLMYAFDRAFDAALMSLFVILRADRVRYSNTTGASLGAISRAIGERPSRARQRASSAEDRAREFRSTLVRALDAARQTPSQPADAFSPDLVRKVQDCVVRAMEVACSGAFSQQMNALSLCTHSAILVYSSAVRTLCLLGEPNPVRASDMPVLARYTVLGSVESQKMILSAVGLVEAGLTRTLHGSGEQGPDKQPLEGMAQERHDLRVALQQFQPSTPAHTGPLARPSFSRDLLVRRAWPLLARCSARAMGAMAIEFVRLASSSTKKVQFATAADHVECGVPVLMEDERDLPVDAHGSVPQNASSQPEGDARLQRSDPGLPGMSDASDARRHQDNGEHVSTVEAHVDHVPTVSQKACERVATLIREALRWDQWHIVSGAVLCETRSSSVATTLRNALAPLQSLCARIVLVSVLASRYPDEVARALSEDPFTSASVLVRHVMRIFESIAFLGAEADSAPRTIQYAHRELYSAASRGVALLVRIAEKAEGVGVGISAAVLSLGKEALRSESIGADDSVSEHSPPKRDVRQRLQDERTWARMKLFLSFFQHMTSLGRESDVARIRALKHHTCCACVQEIVEELLAAFAEPLTERHDLLSSALEVVANVAVVQRLAAEEEAPASSNAESGKSRSEAGDGHAETSSRTHGHCEAHAECGDPGDTATEDVTVKRGEPAPSWMQVHGWAVHLCDDSSPTDRNPLSGWTDSDRRFAAEAGSSQDRMHILRNRVRVHEYMPDLLHRPEEDDDDDDYDDDYGYDDDEGDEDGADRVVGIGMFRHSSPDSPLILDYSGVAMQDDEDNFVRELGIGGANDENEGAGLLPLDFAFVPDRAPDGGPTAERTWEAPVDLSSGIMLNSGHSMRRPPRRRTGNESVWDAPSHAPRPNYGSATFASSAQRELANRAPQMLESGSHEEQRLGAVERAQDAAAARPPGGAGTEAPPASRRTAASGASSVPREEHSASALLLGANATSEAIGAPDWLPSASQSLRALTRTSHWLCDTVDGRLSSQGSISRSGNATCALSGSAGSVRGTSALAPDENPVPFARREVQETPGGTATVFVTRGTSTADGRAPGSVQEQVAPSASARGRRTSRVISMLNAQGVVEFAQTGRVRSLNAIVFDPDSSRSGLSTPPRRSARLVPKRPYEHCVQTIVGNTAIDVELAVLRSLDRSACEIESLLAYLPPHERAHRTRNARRSFLPSLIPDIRHGRAQGVEGTIAESDYEALDAEKQCALSTRMLLDFLAWSSAATRTRAMPVRVGLPNALVLCTPAAMLPFVVQGTGPLVSTMSGYERSFGDDDDEFAAHALETFMDYFNRTWPQVREPSSVAPPARRGRFPWSLSQLRSEEQAQVIVVAAYAPDAVGAEIEPFDALVSHHYSSHLQQLFAIKNESRGAAAMLRRERERERVQQERAERERARRERAERERAERERAEQERAERERAEHERAERERAERERAERERAERERAESERAVVESGQTVEQLGHGESNGSSSAPGAEQAQQAGPDTVARVQIDSSVLDALPSELREEALRSQISAIHEEGGALDLQSVAALAAPLRAIAEEMEAARARTQRTANSASAPQQAQHAEGVVDSETLMFLSSLPLDLRREVLAAENDDFVQALPPELRIEAEEARAEMGVRRAPVRSIFEGGPRRIPGEIDMALPISHNPSHLDPLHESPGARPLVQPPFVRLRSVAPRTFSAPLIRAVVRCGSSSQLGSPQSLRRALHELAPQAAMLPDVAHVICDELDLLFKNPAMGSGNQVGAGAEKLSRRRSRAEAVQLLLDMLMSRYCYSTAEAVAFVCGKARIVDRLREMSEYVPTQAKRSGKGSRVPQPRNMRAEMRSREADGERSAGARWQLENRAPRMHDVGSSNTRERLIGARGGSRTQTGSRTQGLNSSADRRANAHSVDESTHECRLRCMLPLARRVLADMVDDGGAEEDTTSPKPTPLARVLDILARAVVDGHFKAVAESMCGIAKALGTFCAQFSEGKREPPSEEVAHPQAQISAREIVNIVAADVAAEILRSEVHASEQARAHGSTATTRDDAAAERAERDLLLPWLRKGLTLDACGILRESHVSFLAGSVVLLGQGSSAETVCNSLADLDALFSCGSLIQSGFAEASRVVVDELSARLQVRRVNAATASSRASLLLPDGASPLQELLLAGIRIQHSAKKVAETRGSSAPTFVLDTTALEPLWASLSDWLDFACGEVLAADSASQLPTSRNANNGEEVHDRVASDDGDLSSPDIARLVANSARMHGRAPTEQRSAALPAGVSQRAELQVWMGPLAARVLLPQELGKAKEFLSLRRVPEKLVPVMHVLYPVTPLLDAFFTCMLYATGKGEGAWAAESMGERFTFDFPPRRRTWPLRTAPAHRISISRLLGDCEFFARPSSGDGVDHPTEGGDHAPEERSHAGELDRARAADLPDDFLATPLHSPLASPTTTVGSGMLFYRAFCRKHRELINNMFRLNKARLANSAMAVLLLYPWLLDFDNKAALFKIARAEDRDQHPRAPVLIRVRRSHILEDSFRALAHLRPEELRGRISVGFSGEDGIDAGGVMREWFLELSKTMLNPNFALFAPSVENNHTYQPSPLSGVNSDHIALFHFVGRIVGKALYDGQLLDAHFTRPVYKLMASRDLTFTDLEATDPTFYQSLQWMLDNPIEGVLELTFTSETDAFGEKIVTELKPGGREIRVTDANKAEYVKLITSMRLRTAIEEQLNAFLKGFHEIIPSGLVRIFDANELELLLCGLPQIDIDDLERNTVYSYYDRNSEQIQWFWQVVREMQENDLALLVQFVTGTSKVPLEGFSALQGVNGPQKFSIHRGVQGEDHLPSAHTCFNQLDLPCYSSLEKLRTQLLVAIREGSSGFGFG